MPALSFSPVPTWVESQLCFVKYAWLPFWPRYFSLLLNLFTFHKKEKKKISTFTFAWFIQVGADVPAESFQLSPIDQVFVRMGAKDHIMAGQSTFLTELTETASMLVRLVAVPYREHSTHMVDDSYRLMRCP